MKNLKKTSAQWTKIYNLKLNNLAGFPNEDYYNKIYINATDFLSMVANCQLEKPAVSTRREASKLKRKLLPKE